MSTYPCFCISMPFQMLKSKKSGTEKGTASLFMQSPFSSPCPHLPRPESGHHESQLLTKYVHENLRHKDMARSRLCIPETCH